MCYMRPGSDMSSQYCTKRKNAISVTQSSKYIKTFVFFVFLAPGRWYYHGRMWSVRQAMGQGRECRSPNSFTVDYNGLRGAKTQNLSTSIFCQHQTRVYFPWSWCQSAFSSTWKFCQTCIFSSDKATNNYTLILFASNITSTFWWKNLDFNNYLGFS